MKKIFVFDLDDTLIDNVHDYAHPLLDAAGYIVDTLGSKAPHVKGIIKMEDEIDKRRVDEINPSTERPYLYSMERFPGSLVEVYREICKRGGIEPRKDHERSLYAIGLGAFDIKRYAKNIKPEAKSLIDFLRKESKDLVFLVTKGDPLVQNNKIGALETAGIWFDNIRIVDKKTPDIFSYFVTTFPDHQYFSVGNSYKSDIEPALEIDKFKGILIPVETWDILGRLNEMLAGVDRERCHVFDNLGEIKAMYGRL